MFKFNGDLYVLKDDRISSGNVNMAKIYERLLSTNILREKRRDSFDPHRVTLLGEKRRDSFDPHRVTLLGEDIICRVNLLEIPRVIVFFFFFIISLTSFGCLRREVLFCQASMKIKMSPLSVHS